MHHFHSCRRQHGPLDRKIYCTEEAVVVKQQCIWNILSALSIGAVCDLKYLKCDETPLSGPRACDEIFVTAAFCNIRRDLFILLPASFLLLCSFPRFLLPFFYLIVLFTFRQLHCRTTSASALPTPSSFFLQERYRLPMAQSNNIKQR